MSTVKICIIMCGTTIRMIANHEVHDDDLFFGSKVFSWTEKIQR